MSVLPAILKWTGHNFIDGLTVEIVCRKNLVPVLFVDNTDERHDDLSEAFS
jgi:hypothetical protein